MEIINAESGMQIRLSNARDVLMTDPEQLISINVQNILIKKPDDVIIFWKQHNVFSNFHMCNLSVFGIEHAYQYCKLRYIDQEELADEILLCDTPRQAKTSLQKYPTTC